MNSSGGSANSKKRRLVENDNAAAAGYTSVATNTGGQRPAGPLRAIVTTTSIKSDPPSTGTHGSSTSTHAGTGGTATGTANSRLLSSVAMDLAHSMALTCSSLPSLSAVAASSTADVNTSPFCRGCCGGTTTTSSTGAGPKEAKGDTDINTSGMAVLPASPSSALLSARSEGDTDGNAALGRHRPTQQGQKQCRCVDVVYIRHDSGGGGGATGDTNNTNTDGQYDDLQEEEAELFPLRCRRVGREGVDAEGAVGQGGEGSQWDEDALTRIEIRHVRNGADLIQYLASISMMPSHQQPLGGIVVDNVAKFVRGAAASTSTTGSSSLDSAIALAQICK